MAVCMADAGLVIDDTYDVNAGVFVGKQPIP